MPKKIMLIVNPFSGRGLSKNTLGVIVSLLCSEGYIVSVFSTELDCPDALAREYAKDYDSVVCVGGDGTLSGAAAGLMQIDAPPPLGFIPNGTTNDLAATFALSRDPKAAVTAFIKGCPVPLDIGTFDDRYFTYIAAFGAFTGASYSTKQTVKRALGHFAYVIDGLASMPTIRPEHTIVEYDDGVIEGDYIFGSVTNSTSIGGLVKLDKKTVDLQDGLFEVILVKKPVNMSELGTIIGSILNHAVHSEKVQLLHTRKVKFTFDTDVVWTTDGEHGGKHRELVIENRQHALQIIV